MKTNELKLSGKVQGVYFRASAKQKANMLGVNGFIKNERDGSVIVNIEGEDEAVSSMINWCRQGPALARVKNIEITDSQAQNFDSFRIQH